MPKLPARVIAPLLLVLLTVGLFAGGYYQIQRQRSSQAVIHALMTEMTDNHKALQEALDHGGDANATGQFGSTAAGTWEQILIMFHLKEGGPSTPALSIATEIHDPTAVQLLLSHGANPNIRDTNGYTPIMDTVQMWQSCYADVPDYLHPRHPAPAWAIADDQKNAATYAGILSLLKAKGGDVNATKDDGTTALMLAASQHKPEMVKLLLDNGADVNRALSDGETALSQAVWTSPGSRDVETLKLLLQHGANPNVKTPNGGSPLQQASEWINKPADLLLLQYGADPNVRSPANGMTPLMQAARQGQYAVAKMALDKGADPNAGGGTTLFLAINGHYTDIVKLLLERGADPSMGLNGQERVAPLMEAAYQHDLPIVRLLLAHGVHINTTALIEDAHQRVRRTLRDRAAQLAIAGLLLAHGANPNATNQDGKTALDFAKANGKTALITLLRAHGAKG